MSKIPGLINKVRIKADAKGNPPTEIELLHTGTWNTPWHGDFIISPDDIQEYVANFKAGVGLVKDDPRGPIDYGHDDGGKAAGWINSVHASTDGQSLIGEVEWTPAGAQAIKDGEWAYISSEFNPTGCLPWEDPEEEFNFVGNVITGAALTNIPLFKKLKPIMASRLPDKKKKAAATPGDGGKSNQGESMNIEDIRKKQVADLTEDEKKFLGDHKAELTEDERKTFGLEEADDDAAAKAAAEKEAADKAAAEQAEKEKAEAEAKAAEEAAKVEADAKGGVKISADRLAKLEADAQAGREAQQKLARKEAQDFIAASVRKGQVKSGEAENAVNLLLASSGDNRSKLEAFINGLPVNEKLGKEIGDAGKESTGAKDELHAKVVASVKASAAKGKNVTYASARKEILSADTALAARVKEEEENK